jgi:hypothetical protein
MDKFLLDNKQTMDLAMLGHIYINGKIHFRKSRHDNVLQANKCKVTGDIVAENNTAVFILNPNRN